MNNQIPECTKSHPAIIEFGKKFIQNVYDSSINTFFSIYEMGKEVRTPFSKEVQFLTHTFSEEQMKEVQTLTKTIAFCTANLELCFFDRHSEYKILVEENHKRVAISEITKGLREVIMSKNGLISHVSEYYINLLDNIEEYCVMHQNIFDNFMEQKK